MYQLAGKRILLGVTGGIAAYKAAVLLRLLRQAGAEVRVVMTKNACEFVTPLTFQALSAKPVHVDMLDLEAETAMGHIELARWADLVVVAPASANFIARYTNGLADDLLSTLCLAADSPVMIAPAMNQQMWLNAATQENIARLKSRNIQILGPAEGDQACGETGPGRLLEPEQILTLLGNAFETTILTGSHVLVTAGPTREAIDPVRYITNRSSGRMGFAVARAALEAGARVSLISGPVNLQPPDKTELTLVNTADEMHKAVMQNVADADIFIAAAAVADYRFTSTSEQKIKKTDDTLNFNMIKNPDILADVAGMEKRPFTVGFAAETEDLINNAQSKLEKKNLDMIAANQVGENQGFDQEHNALTVLWKNGQQNLEQAPKEKLARKLISLVANHYNEKITNQAH